MKRVYVRLVGTGRSECHFLSRVPTAGETVSALTPNSKIGLANCRFTVTAVDHFANCFPERAEKEDENRRVPDAQCHGVFVDPSAEDSDSVQSSADDEECREWVRILTYSSEWLDAHPKAHLVLGEVCLVTRGGKPIRIEGIVGAPDASPEGLTWGVEKS